MFQKDFGIVSKSTLVQPSVNRSSRAALNQMPARMTTDLPKVRPQIWRLMKYRSLFIRWFWVVGGCPGCLRIHSFGLAAFPSLASPR